MNAPADPPKWSQENGYTALWLARCQKTENGTAPICNLYNALIGLSEDPELQDLLLYDEMARTVIVKRTVPSDDPEQEPETYYSPATDNDTLAFQKLLQKAGLKRIARETVGDAISFRAQERSFHPVRDYLNGLKWDGKLRLKRCLATYLGAPYNEYSSHAGPMFIMSMVARIFEPGCQADYMLVLEGAQGIGKSSACRILAAPWFSDNMPDLNKADPIRLSMHLRDKWLIEIAELSSFGTAAVEDLKKFITTTEERYTPKFGRREVYEPRQCLLIGTTNQTVYLKDPTGARQFWPVKCGAIDLPALARDRDQLLAEAMEWYRAGVPRFPDSKREEEVFKPQQEARYEVDAWEEAIAEYLDGRTETTLGKVGVDALHFTKANFKKTEQTRAAAIMERHGWERRPRQKFGVPWVRRKP